MFPVFVKESLICFKIIAKGGERLYADRVLLLVELCAFLSPHIHIWSGFFSTSESLTWYGSKITKFKGGCKFSLSILYFEIKHLSDHFLQPRHIRNLTKEKETIDIPVDGTEGKANQEKMLPVKTNALA